MVPAESGEAGSNLQKRKESKNKAIVFVGMTPALNSRSNWGREMDVGGGGGLEGGRYVLRKLR